MAVAVDTGRTFYRTGGNWVGVGGNAVPTGTTDPAIAASALGDLFWNSTASQMKVFDGAAWLPIAASSLNDLTDVDLTTAPQSKETLVFDAGSNTFKPGKGGGVLVTEPPVSDRFAGMLYDDGVRTWIWLATPGCWREV
jgi:hypothetical protein